MLRARFAAVLVTAIALGLPLAGQQGEELARLRDDHEKSVAAAARMVDDVYRLTLRQLEKQRAEAADYEGAQRAKDKLDALDKEPGAALILTKPPPYTLLAALSQTRDGANTDSSRQYVDFKKFGGKAAWDVLTIEPGTYEVFLTYSVGLPVFNVGAVKDPSDPASIMPGGVVSFYEVTGLAAPGTDPLEKKITTTGSWENFIRESLGRYEFKSKSVRVRVEAVAATGGGLMHLRQVELVRVSGASTTASGSQANPAQVLKELRLKYKEAMAAASAGVETKYVAEFEQLEQQLNASGDRAGGTAVARARRDLFKEQDDQKSQEKP